VSRPRVIIKANPKRNSQAELVKALSEQTTAINQLVGMVVALIAHIEDEQVGEQVSEQVRRYMDGTPKG